jgi:lia operon protein LiaG
MNDKLKIFVQENRGAFDHLDVPDVWSAIQTGLAQPSSIVQIKNITNMLKYGFGASAIAIAGFIAVQQHNISSQRAVLISGIEKPSRTLLDSSPSLFQMPVFVNHSPDDTSKRKRISYPPALSPAAVVTPEAPESPESPEPPVQETTAMDFKNYSGDKDSAFAANGRTTIDTVFHDIKQLEVNAKFCNVNVKAVKGNKLRLKGAMNESGGELVICGVHAYRKKEYIIRCSREGDLLKVWIDEEDLPKKENVNSKNGGDSYLDFEVPEETGLRINNSSGNIKASGSHASRIQLRSQFGNVSADHIEGEAELKTSSGNINVSEISGNVKSETAFGSQQFDNIKGNMSLRSSSGDITITQLRGNADVISSFGHQRYTTIEGDITGRASSGNVVIRHLKGNLTLKTTFGTQEYEDVEGNINSRSSSGDIRIDGAKGQISLGTSFGSIRGKNVRLLSAGDFKATSGNISMNLLNDLNELRFDLIASSGDLSVEKGNTKSRSDHELQVGDGPILIKGVTSFGNQNYK